MLSLEGGEYVSLNGTAATVWHALDAPASDEQIATRLGIPFRHVHRRAAFCRVHPADAFSVSAKSHGVQADPGILHLQRPENT